MSGNVSGEAMSSTIGIDKLPPSSPILAPYIRFEFSGAGSNGAYKQARGVLHRQ